MRNKQTDGHGLSIESLLHGRSSVCNKSGVSQYRTYVWSWMLRSNVSKSRFELSICCVHNKSLQQIEVMVFGFTMHQPITCVRSRKCRGQLTTLAIKVSSAEWLQSLSSSASIIDHTYIDLYWAKSLHHKTAGTTLLIEHNDCRNEILKITVQQTTKYVIII